jgi:hypothetical protein
LDRLFLLKVGGAAKAGATQVHVRYPLAYRFRPFQVGGVSMVRLLGKKAFAISNRLYLRNYLREMGMSNKKRKKEKNGSVRSPSKLLSLLALRAVSVLRL